MCYDAFKWFCEYISEFNKMFLIVGRHIHRGEASNINIQSINDRVVQILKGK